MTTCSVNLLPADRVSDSHIRRRTKVWCAVWVGSAALLAGAYIAWCGEGTTQDPLQAEEREVAANVTKRSNELDEVNKQIAVVQRQIDAARAVGHHPDWSQLVNVLVRSSTPDIHLSKLSVLPDLSIDPGVKKDKSKAGIDETSGPQRYTVRLAGFAGSQGTLGAFITNVETLKLFDRITIEETRSQEMNGTEWTAFAVVAVLPDSSNMTAAKEVK